MYPFPDQEWGMISQASVLHGWHCVFFFWAKETKRVKQTKQFLPQNRQISPGGRLEQEYCCSYTATDGHCRYCACDMSCLWFLLFATYSWLAQSLQRWQLVWLHQRLRHRPLHLLVRQGIVHKIHLHIRYNNNNKKYVDALNRVWNSTPLYTKETEMAAHVAATGPAGTTIFVSIISLIKIFTRIFF